MSSAIPSSGVIGVVGAGAMGTGIAQLAAAAGHRVVLFDTREGAAASACASVRKVYASLVEKGRLSPEQATTSSANLSAANTLEDCRDAALVIEAIVEQLDAKQQLFLSLEKIVSDTCILATNTSSISVTAIAAKLAHPQRLVGMHFFNPVPLMQLVEVISGLATSASVADRIVATASAWGKLPVRATSTPGFIVNRVARPFYAEGLRLLLEQAADPATIDAVMREAGGFRMGPFELMDLIGHDVNYAVTQSVFDAYYHDPRFTPSIIQKELLNAGFLGRKSGRGFYPYGEGAQPPSPQQLPACTESSESSEPVLNPSSVIGSIIAARLGAAGIAFGLMESGLSEAPLLMVDDASLYLTDGRSATLRAAEYGKPDTVLIDLALDFEKTTRLAIAAADQCSAKALDAIAGVLQAAGYRVSLLRDVPGMAVMRTVAMLANEAADAVNQGVCTAADADLAMQKGVNYPLGPLAWAERIGVDTILRVLQRLSEEYGEDRYRASPLLRRVVASGKRSFST
ncbi:MAG: 3-hydroxyacyl-CoA dehydrogenase [Oxalobacteraceae bacterium]